MENTLLLLFATAGIIAGWMVISATNPIHAILSLVLAFANLSILLLMLGLEFLSLLFIIVYVGAIAILFLFVIMMLNIKAVETLDNTSRYLPIGMFLGLILLWQLYIVFNNEINAINLGVNGNLNTDNNYFEYYCINRINDIKQLGFLLYTEYFVYFFVGGLILLVAMVGAIVLTMTHETSVKRQDLFRQIATKNEKTINNVS